MSKPNNVYLIRGDDSSVLSRELDSLTNRLLEGEDKSLVVEELTESQYESESGLYSIESLVNAAQTVPFLTERRIIIGRHFARFHRLEELGSLIDYFEDIIETNFLILVWEKGPNLQRLSQPPKKLLELISGCGEIIDVRVGKKVSGWIRGKVAESSIALDEGALGLMERTIGEEISRVSGILDTLESVFGVGSQLKAVDIEPYIGQSGNVPPWELTDRISSGNAGLSIETLTRMQANGRQHQMQILGYLTSHYSRILQLADQTNLSADEAANILGDKSSFRARKTLSEAKRLGGNNAKRAIQLLAEADLDLKGATGVPLETVMEVLVARLSSLYRG